MSDTPRTDEAQFGTGRVSVDFARTLESELNAANERINRLEEVLNTLTLVVGLTPIAGNKVALQEAFDMARSELKAKEAL